MGTKNDPGEFDCHAAATEHEASPAREWRKRDEAEAVARAMDRWRSSQDA